MSVFAAGDLVKLIGSLWRDDEYNLKGSIIRIEGVDGEGAFFHHPEGTIPDKLYVYQGEYDGELDRDWGGMLVGHEPLRTESNDDVNHPSHYTSYKGIEVIQLTEQMNFNRGNAVKYVARAGLKNPDTEIQDLEKAVWYLQREIERLKNA